MEWNITAIVFAANGTGPNQVDLPFSLFIPDGSDFLYVADYGNHRVLQYSLNDSTATVVAGGQDAGSNSTQLHGPGAVFVDSNGGILVADSANFRAQYFVSGSRVGRTVAGNGTKGPASTQLGDAIGGIAIDSDNNIYITEYANSRVAKWAPNATYGITVAGDGFQDNTPGRLNFPTGLYLDPVPKILYVASQSGHCIVKWLSGASTGSTVAGTCGINGSNETLLTTPKGVTFDKYGNMYVADLSGGGRIISFSPNSPIGRPIITSGLNNPMAVAVDKDLTLYVADCDNKRIVRYSLL